MSLLRRYRSRISTTVPQAGHSCLVESLESRALFSASLKVISLTPPAPKAAVHAKAPKVPKAVKVGAIAKKSHATVSSSSGEKHVDYGVSQFGV